MIPDWMKKSDDYVPVNDNNTFIKTIAIYIDTKNSNRIIATNNIDIIKKMLTAHPAGFQFLFRIHTL